MRSDEQDQPTWQLRPFSELMSGGTRNGLYKPKKFHGRGAKIVNMGELFAHPRLGDVEMRRIEVDENELEKYALAPGDLLFARRSLVAEGAGKCVVVVDCPEETVFESSIIRVRPNESVVAPDYLYYLFSSEVGNQIMDTIRKRDAVSGITGSDLVTLELPVPDLATQKSIASFFAAIDNKIANNRALAADLEAIACAIFKSWFVDFDPVKAKMEGRAPAGMDAETAALFPDELVESKLGLIPKGWEVGCLTDAFELNPRYTLKKGVPAPYLEMSKVPVRGHVPDEVVLREFSSGTKFQNGDTLLARITPCLENGKAAHVDFLTDNHVGWGSTEFIVLRAKPPFPPYFGYLLCRLDAFREHAISSMTGTSGRQRIQPDSLARWQLALPRKSICRKFDHIIDPLRAKIRQLGDESQELAQLRDALLPRLISGKLRLPEAETVTGQEMAE